MGTKDNIFDRYLAAHPSALGSDRRLRFLLKCIQKLSGEQLNADHSSDSEIGSFPPFESVPQVVLRRQGQVPVKMLVRLHSLFKSELKGVNEVFNGLNPDHHDAILIYCVLSALCSEHLKVTAQLVGLSLPDAGMTKQTQELFEQFYDAHGTPNDAEMDLLVQVGYVDRDVVDQWFENKESRLRAFASLEGRVLEMLREEPGFMKGVFAQEAQRRQGKKSFFRH